MAEQISISDSEYVVVNRFPDTCGVCHKTLFHSRPFSRAIWRDADRTKLEVVFQCPAHDCRHLLIAYYSVPYAAPFGTPHAYSGVAPWRPAPASFAAEIVAISPSFVEIYNEAKAAEEMKLFQIAGAGYRKALEFLVKDFCVNEKPDDTKRAAEIAHAPLMTVIKTLVQNADIQAAASAERAAWLGNDETHYLRKWRDKDRGDLKALIDITVHSFTTTLKLRGYVQQMPEGKK
jgi:hypothetical protein